MGAALTIMGVNPKQRCIAFTELQSKLNRSKKNLFSTKAPSISARLFSHTARGNVPPFSCRALFRNKVRYNGLGHHPRRRRANPVGSLTHQHHLGGGACRKLGGAGSTPKNTNIVEKHSVVFHRLPTPPCETAARPYALSDVK